VAPIVEPIVAGSVEAGLYADAGSGTAAGALLKSRPLTAHRPAVVGGAKVTMTLLLPPPKPPAVSPAVLPAATPATPTENDGARDGLRDSRPGPSF
jgi:hypothetical protein